MFIMAFNVWMTINGKKREEAPSQATPLVASGASA
jgi:cbb3-type cytochrome oxidase subunit 1